VNCRVVILSSSPTTTVPLRKALNPNIALGIFFIVRGLYDALEKKKHLLNDEKPTDERLDFFNCHPADNFDYKVKGILMHSKIELLKRTMWRSAHLLFSRN